uniref:GAG-pre-integrase domain-containing protein n=1 Tax=Chenopodium quinoa TaxID=63459 RepID=A0A803MVW9_CHEQI
MLPLDVKLHAEASWSATRHWDGVPHRLEVGYPEWWDDLKQRRAATKATASRTGGKAHLTMGLSNSDEPPATEPQPKTRTQDAQTRQIIGHGTERGGLYYVDEATQQGQAMLAHGSPEHQVWMWHRRLGHPSLGY